MLSNKMNSCIHCDHDATFVDLSDYEKQFCENHKSSDSFLISEVKQGKFCSEPNCSNLPKFVFKKRFEKFATFFCESHKIIRSIPFDFPYVEIKPKIKKNFFCESKHDCSNIPYYNFPNKKYAAFCKKHKTNDMINVYTIKCENKTCFKTAYYNFHFEIQPIFCKKHKTDEMFNIFRRKCENSTCIQDAYYNFPNKKPAIFCFKHKTNDMINVNLKLCQHCTNVAKFNFPNKKTPLFCFDHKQHDMIHTNIKICEHCSLPAKFNFPNEKTPSFCFNHKQHNMIKIVKQKHNSCQTKHCNLQKSFNFPHLRTPVFCFFHALPDMIDVRINRCNSQFCFNVAIFGLPESHKPVFCKLHAENNMISLYKQFCYQHKCSHKPKFNFPNCNFGLFCSRHKQHNMVDVTVKCNFDSCSNQRFFGFTSDNLLFCSKHKSIDMISPPEYQCSKCFNKFDIVVNNVKFCLACEPDNTTEIIIKQKCKYCDIEPKSNFVCHDCLQNKCKKEIMVMQFIRDHISAKFVYNSSSMLDNCSKKRPDLFFDLPLHSIVVEIDEFQHKNYNELCECARLNQIANALGGKSVIFIRFNPDNILHNGSPLLFDMRHRLQTLVDVLKREISHSYDTLVAKVIQLFFDSNSTDYLVEQTVDITNSIFI